MVTYNKTGVLARGLQKRKMSHPSPSREVCRVLPGVRRTSVAESISLYCRYVLTSYVALAHKEQHRWNIIRVFGLKIARAIPSIYLCHFSSQIALQLGAKEDDTKIQKCIITLTRSEHEPRLHVYIYQHDIDIPANPLTPPPPRYIIICIKTLARMNRWCHIVMCR